MTLCAGVAAWVLFSALLHATRNLLIKGSADRLLDTAALALAASALCAPTLPFLPLPAPESRPLLALSVVILAFCFLVLIKTYRWADLSSAYPMMRGTAPVLVALTFAALTVGSYGIVIRAMTVAPVAAVAALRETSVVFAAAMGALVLREPLGAWRIAGAGVVAAGAVVIRLGA